MKILVIDQCSKAKEYGNEFTPFDQETLDSHSLSELQEQPHTPAIEARKLYSGRQQQYIGDAIASLRAAGDEVDRYFISAGFGLVEESERLPPYDVTFAEKTNGEIERRGEHLKIECQIIELLDANYDLVFFALGSDYYASFDFANVLAQLREDTWGICFNRESMAEAFENVVSLPARTEQAKEHGTIVVALKGRYLQNFAEHRSHGKETVDIADVEKYCTESYTSQTELN